MNKKIHAVLMCIFLMLSFFVIPSAASENTDASRISASMNSFFDADGEIIGVSSKGEWDNFPENSIPAIVEAAKTDIDFVAVDVKRTVEGTLILFADDTTERMLDSEDIFAIEETAYSILSAYSLRNSCGGSNEKVTQYNIPTLSDAVIAAKENDIPLIIRCDISVLSEVTSLLSEENALDMCIVLVNADNKEISSALSLCEEKPYLIGAKKGNVIFNILSFISFLSDNDFLGAQLMTVNRYSINYYKSLIGLYSENLRIICDTTTPEISGYRYDSATWWDDLISRGYSVIFTDHADIFCEYKDNIRTAKARLTELYDKHVTNNTLPAFKDENLNDLKKAYTDAVSFAESLLSDNSVSLQQLNDCYAELSKASADISKNFSSLEDGSAGTTITVPRIILCAIALFAVIVVQIYFFKRRKKVG